MPHKTSQCYSIGINFRNRWKTCQDNQAHPRPAGGNDAHNSAPFGTFGATVTGHVSEITPEKLYEIGLKRLEVAAAGLPVTLQWLLLIYAKNKNENIPAHVLKAIKEELEQ